MTTIDQRLQKLRARRSGADRAIAVAMDQQIEILREQLLGEAYERRAMGKPFTRYALGAMQEVDPDYTRISIETATRVENQLQRRLSAEGLNTTYRLQGSVPLNVHIRGVSDVDLLTIGLGSLFYAPAGVHAQRGGYSPPARDTTSFLRDLRRTSETSLRTAFPAVHVDTTNAKAIKLTGGSLPRPVDVVPAVWWDTEQYQFTGLEHDRGVSIYHKFDHATIDNLPFLHIKRVADRDAAALGSLRKAIRLCKNVKADAEDEGTTIALSSYVLYHADLTAWRSGAQWELGILAEAQRHLDWCYRNPPQAQALMTPDGSRCILETAEKSTALMMLSSEMDKLLRQVAREQSVQLYLQESPSLDSSRRAIEQLIIH
ncbi:hypothetical protein BJD12_01870 [Xanthomonas vesicatoria ATCC 35937]|uniref:Uncharacterized protein n=1 Tax=Xanthomonas vesicatoria ATCC 35937 TaxID=925775 RepID=F0BHM3_9XANT|nr:hypothetical protein [Xanthomonas vesicatoria]APP74214.1 hypothetical protein BJD12_01870 [Xanthomonas vesicatoria ATCC 35937]EGD08026.1 hypothetical protein XVE_3765 [Xanthomonas vesicatoria ATCC 35937]KTF34216.1 hypothetical protein LMG920_06905 [Xanthomonas vesicatoria]MCC8598022.1 hypothetical protein [Xanthomonas vesicatoria]MCC8605875.1 hypothetical protein [Xanthomonas vesicatoria]